MITRKIKEQVYRSHVLGFLTWREMMCNISIEESRAAIKELAKTLLVLKDGGRHL